ncbi:MAG: acetolactate synthase, partial [Pirellulaceae bacterium]|nr:acetolactate synthase [Pirellulaceae bacterium]
KVGKLLELVELFDGPDLRIVALSVIDAADHAVVRLVTSREAVARKLLKQQQLPFREAEILIVELGPQQGRTLTFLCKMLLSAELNIHFAYPLMVRPHGAPTIALHTDDQVLSGQILHRKRFPLLGENDLTDQFHFGDPFDSPLN